MSLGTQHLPGRRMASALVITLAVVTLMSILLLGFLSGVRTETASARTHVNGEKAVMFAQMGVDAAQARLAAAMPKVGTVNTMVLATGTTPTSTATANVAPFWVAQPGRILIKPSGSPVPSPLPTPADLSSGASTSATDDSADLNPATLTDANQRLLTQADNTIFPAGDPSMRVRWRYVRGNGTFIDTLPTMPPADAASQVVGRFAFWADDMSARINVNTAWTRDATSNSKTAQSHPSRVSLASLPLLLLPASTSEPDAINNYRLNQRLFNTIPELQTVDATTAQIPGQYPLDLTHYSHSLDLNMLGERRIVLTTQKNLAGDAEFLDILDPRYPNTDPGCFYKLDLNSYNSTGQGSNKVITVVRRLAGLLMRTDWPIAPGASFPTKYADDGWAYQTAINIIDYVRSCESKNPIVEPLRLDYFPLENPGKVAINSSSVSMLGNSRRPVITEFGVWYGATKTQGCIYRFRVHLPKNSGFASGPLDLLRPFGSNSDIPAGDTNGLWLTVSTGNPDGPKDASGNTPMYLTALNAPVLQGAAHTTADGNAYVDTSTLSEGGCRTISFCAAWDTRILVSGARPSRVLLSCSLQTTPRAVVNGQKEVSFDSAPVVNTTTNQPVYALDAVTPVTAASSISSLAVTTDPRLNKDPSNFKQGAGNFNSTTLDFGTPATTVGLLAPQDTDSSGKIVTDSVHLPAIKGDTNNQSGVVSSVGELGYIHSGMQCRGGFGTGTPWRTLRFQAQPTSATTSGLLPDWVIMDLFAAPVVTSATTPVIAPVSVEAALLKPTARSTAGKVNLNAKIYPFADASGNPLMSRLEPLRSLLYGAKKTDASTPTVGTADVDNLPGNLVDNIAKYNTVSGTNGLLGKDYGASGNAAGVYFAPGQLAEIKGIGDAGEAGEGLLREIGELATARGGNVFSIYAVGQTIQQTKNGSVIVLGERRCQRVVERWENVSPGTTPTTPGAVANVPTRATITTQFRTVYSHDLTP